MPGDRNGLVAELYGLSAVDRLAGRSTQLASLAKDLDTGKRLDSWAEVDVTASFSPERSIGAAPTEPRFGRFLDHLPTALVFLPILVTWGGLSMAANAHGRSQGDTALEGMSFLERWQGGFNGALPGFFTFDNIAYSTLSGIVLLIISVVGQSVYRKRAEAWAETERADLARRLTSVMTAVQFELGTVRLGSPARIAADLGASVEHMRETNRLAQQAQQDVRTTLTETRENLRAAHSAIAVLKESMDTVAQVIREGGDVLEEFHSRLAEVSSAVDRVADESSRFTTSAKGELARVREELDGGITRLTEQVRASVAEGQGLMSDSVENSSANLQRALETGESMIREVFEDWQATSVGFAHRFEQAADVSGRVVESMNALPEAVDRLNAGIDTLLARQAADTDPNPNVTDTRDIENDARSAANVVSR